METEIFKCENFRNLRGLGLGGGRQHRHSSLPNPLSNGFRFLCNKTEVSLEYFSSRYGVPRQRFNSSYQKRNCLGKIHGISLNSENSNKVPPIHKETGAEKFFISSRTVCPPSLLLSEQQYYNLLTLYTLSFYASLRCLCSYPLYMTLVYHFAKSAQVTWPFNSSDYYLLFLLFLSHLKYF